MNNIISIICGILAANVIAACVGYSGLYRRIPNYCLILMGWTVSAAVALITHALLTNP